jgi:type II secretory pathway pseudopilin PulG
MSKSILKNAYSLLELTIVITVTSFVITSLLSVSENKEDNDKIKETLEKMQFIEKSIAYYLAEYGAIPCPADASLASDHASFGIATRNNSDITKCNGTTSAGYYSAIFPAFTLGSLPTNTLQIPDDYAYDAWGRRFTYSMIENCNASNIEYLAGYNYMSASNPNYNSFSVNNFSSNSCGKSFADKSALQIQNSFSGGITVNNAVYVLISHGRNGHGAYAHNGGTNKIISNAVVETSEENNGLLSKLGVVKTASGIYVQKPLEYNNNYFDDLVHYRTKDQIIKEAGVFSTNNQYSSSICNMAKNIATSIDTFKYCPPTTNPPTTNINCIVDLSILAWQINSLCF